MLNFSHSAGRQVAVRQAFNISHRSRPVAKHYTDDAQRSEKVFFFWFVFFFGLPKKKMNTTF
jgi:hypothetical protein